MLTFLLIQMVFQTQIIAENGVPCTAYFSLDQMSISTQSTLGNSMCNADWKMPNGYSKTFTVLQASNGEGASIKLFFSNIQTETFNNIIAPAPRDYAFAEAVMAQDYDVAGYSSCFSAIGNENLYYYGFKSDYSYGKWIDYSNVAVGRGEIIISSNAYFPGANSNNSSIDASSHTICPYWSKYTCPDGKSYYFNSTNIVHIEKTADGNVLIQVRDKDNTSTVYAQISTNFDVSRYTVIFKNDDGSELWRSDVAYNQTPSYNGPTPNKPADAQYTYTFNGWTPKITAVTGDVTYTATYSKTLNKHNVTFLNEDGSTIECTQWEYGTFPICSTIPAKSADEGHSYTFIGWTPRLSTVTGETSYTAVYKDNTSVFTSGTKTSFSVYNYNDVIQMESTQLSDPEDWHYSDKNKFWVIKAQNNSRTEYNYIQLCFWINTDTELYAYGDGSKGVKPGSYCFATPKVVLSSTTGSYEYYDWYVNDQFYNNCAIGYFKDSYWGACPTSSWMATNYPKNYSVISMNTAIAVVEEGKDGHIYVEIWQTPADKSTPELEITINVPKNGEINCIPGSGTYEANGDDLKWELSCEGVLTISGSGKVTGSSPSWSYYSSYITSIIINDGITSIGDYAFKDYTNLTDITIPSSVTSIGNSAFSGCSSLTSVTIPNSVTSIGSNAFMNCSNLTSITIPNSVTSIGWRAFKSCSNLTSIAIPSSVTSIGSCAFSGCSNLTSIVWNAKKYNNFTSTNTPFYYYDNSAYSYDNFDIRSQIVSVTFGDEVEYIPAYMCNNLTNLTSITIGNSVKSIGQNAFSNCKISEIYFTKNIEQWCNNQWIPTQITSNTYTLYINNIKASDLVVPDNIINIREKTFYNCISLTSVTIPNSVISIGNYAFFNCKNLTSVTIPNSVTNIGNYAFSNCSGFTSITIPNSATSIGNYAFANCSGFISITIPNSVTDIGQNAFSGCTYLENIIIGSSITSKGIGSSAFANCPYLMSVTCKAEYPPVISSDVFSGCGVLSGIDLYVPKESVKRYQKADVWPEFNIIGKDLSNDDPTNPTNPESGKYTITWQDEEGNVIKTDEVKQDATPAFTGTTPTKEGYTFAGWLPNIKPATEDTKYTTYFIPTQQQESKVYTVNINGENCSLNINNQYPEGTVITLEAVADECFEFQQWSDGNKDNPRTVTVTKDMSLTAEFNKVRYTVTGEPSTGGKVQIRKQ